MKRALLAAALAGCVALLAGFGGPANFGKEGAGFGRPNSKGGGGGNTCGQCLLVDTGSFMLVNTGVKLLIQ